MTQRIAAKPATFFQRFAAYIADTMILIIVWLLLQALIGFTPDEHGRILTFLNLLLSTGYFTYYHARYGATPGKKLMEIRVLSIDGRQLSLLQSFLRYSPYSVIIAMQLFVEIEKDAATLDPAVQLVLMLFLLWHAISVTLILQRPDRRTLHDLLAYTQVLHLPTPITRKQP